MSGRGGIRALRESPGFDYLAYQGELTPEQTQRRPKLRVHPHDVFELCAAAEKAADPG